jgi:hypothetical protein
VERAPILLSFCSCVEILQVQHNLACYGLGMRQPAHGCNVRAKRLTHFIFHPDLFELITAMLFSLPTGLARDHSG